MDILLDEYFNTRLDIRNLIACQPKRASTKKEIINLESQLNNIKFKLELPYKLLELIQEASNESIVIEYGIRDEDFSVTFKNPKDRYNNCYLSLVSNQTEFYEAVDFIQYFKDKRLEEEVKQKLKETALSKLTKEEKEVLELN